MPSSNVGQQRLHESRIPLPMLDDLRYALRMLRKSPGVTLTAILTIALGIGANTSIFSFLNGAFFRSIPAADSQRLVWVIGRGQNGFRNLSYPEFLAYRDSTRVFTGVTAYQDIPVSLGSGVEPERISGLIVTGNYFDVLGVRPVAGRTFAPDEDGVPGASPVVVIGYALWQRLYGGDEAAIGRKVILNGHPFTVIGVAPQGFNGVEISEPTMLWVTMSMAAQAMPLNAQPLADEGSFWLRAIGRLAPGVTTAQAAAAVAVIAQRRALANPGRLRETSATAISQQGGLDPRNRADALPVFLLLMAVPLMVLLIACANVANLLLSRAAARRREVGVRLALGATRRRLVRQLLTESMVLAAAGGVAGFLVSLWITDLVFRALQPPQGVAYATQPDLRVIAFTAGVALLTGILCGLAPALGGSRNDLVNSLKDDSAGDKSRRRSRLTSGFVIGQVATSLVLLVIAGLFLRSLRKATQVEVGFDTRNAVALSFDLSLLGYDRAHRDAFYGDLLERVRALPGTRQATLTSNLPLSGRIFATEVLPAQQRDDREARGVRSYFTWLWPDYFKTMGMRLVAGRDFTLRDDSLAPRAVVVNQALARRLWPNEIATGKQVATGTGPDATVYEVIGVVNDGKYDELTEDPMPFLYVAHRQNADALGEMTLLVRTTGADAQMIVALRSLLKQMDPNLPLFGVHTLSEQVALRLDKERAASKILGAFGALALLLASLGLYGVMAFTVVQRTREIGVRIALGARPLAVLRMVVTDSVRLAAIGIAIGLVLSGAVTQVIRRFLYGVTPTDVTTFAGVAVVLGLVAAAAGWIPARRAASVDPMIALRNE